MASGSGYEWPNAITKRRLTKSRYPWTAERLSSQGISISDKLFLKSRFGTRGALEANSTANTDGEGEDSISVLLTMKDLRIRRSLVNDIPIIGKVDQIEEAALKLCRLASVTNF